MFLTIHDFKVVFCCVGLLQEQHVKLSIPNHESFYPYLDYLSLCPPLFNLRGQLRLW